MPLTSHGDFLLIAIRRKLFVLVMLSASAIAVAETTDPRDELVERDPRIKLDFKEELGVSPQLASIARVVLNADGSSLTGSLVTKCHVLINLHLIEDLPESKKQFGLLKLSDADLAVARDARVTVAFLPNGAMDFRSGFKVIVTGRLVETGRKSYGSFDYMTEIPNKEDFAIVRLDDPKAVSSLTPLEIATELEIDGSNKTGFMVGYPQQLILKYGQNAFAQECAFKSNIWSFWHNCISTAGESSAPFVQNFGSTGKSALKIAGIGRKGKFRADSLDTVGVPAYSFRQVVERLRAEPCR
jgi:hypothetical protein